MMNNSDLPRPGDAFATASPFDEQQLPVIAHLVPNPPGWLRDETALEPDLPIVDPHHHLWEWGGRYLLDEFLADAASGHRLAATVFVQCGHAYRTDGPEALRPVGETEFAVAMAEAAQRRQNATRVCAGIVAYADLALGDEVQAVLEAHAEASQGRLRGIRHITARSESFSASMLGRPPRELLLQPAFRRGLARLQQSGLAFDAMLYHPQIHELAEVARSLPELPIVLNHVGGPLGVGPYHGQREAVFREWRAALQDLARCANISVKLGGLAMRVTGFEFHRQPQPPSSLELASAWGPYIETCIDLFGVRRCMFESNFPMEKVMCSYSVLWNVWKRIASAASAEEKHWLFAGTADAVYRLGLDGR